MIGNGDQAATGNTGAHFIGAGLGNTIGVTGGITDSGVANVIAGGTNNTIGPQTIPLVLNSGSHAIGGGSGNLIGTAGTGDAGIANVIAAGFHNTINPGCLACAVAGGALNNISADVNAGFIGGGQQNGVEASFAVVVGGDGCNAQGRAAFVGGGVGNAAQAEIIADLRARVCDLEKARSPSEGRPRKQSRGHHDDE